MTPYAKHDCQALENTHASIPEDVVLLWWSWRCHRCGQKWRIEESRSHGRSARPRGPASRRWRRDAWKRTAASSTGGK